MPLISSEYEAIRESMLAAIGDEADPIANAANLAAVLMTSVPAIDWAGVYFLRRGELHLGPFQGSPSAARLTLNTSISGRCIRDLRSVLGEERRASSEAMVADETNDAAPGSRLAVPLMAHGRALGTLELASPVGKRFTENDRHGLEALAAAFVEGSDILALAARSSETPVRTAPPKPLVDDLPPDEGTTPVLRDSQRLMPTMTYAEPTPAARPRPQSGGMTTMLIRVGACIVAGAALVSLLRLGGSPLAAMLAFPAYVIMTALVGVAWRLPIGPVTAASVIIAALLTAVRIGTRVDGGPAADVVFIACGAAGGYLGAVSARALRRSPALRGVPARHRP